MIDEIRGVFISHMQGVERAWGLKVEKVERETRTLYISLPEVNGNFSY